MLTYDATILKLTFSCTKVSVAFHYYHRKDVILLLIRIILVFYLKRKMFLHYTRLHLMMSFELLCKLFVF